MFRRFDAWVGTHLFVPIIIRICQLVHTTPKNFSSYTGLFAWTGILSSVIFDAWYDYVLAVVGVVYVFGYMIEISVLNNVTKQPTANDHAYYQERIFIWFIMFVTTLPSVMFLFLYGWKFYFIVTMFLFGAYARTIKTIPPSEIKKKSLQSQTT